MYSRTQRRGHEPWIGPTIAPSWAVRRSAREPLVLGAEPSQPPATRVVVGFDGSSLGLAAVVEAGLRAGPIGCVFVVHVYGSPPRFLGSPYFERHVSDDRSAGRRLLDELWRCRDALPETEYIPELIAGRPADAIARVAEARRADAIVVGIRRTGRTRAPHRSVAGKLLRRAEVSVIIVPDQPQPTSEAGPWGSTPAAQ